MRLEKILKKEAIESGKYDESLIEQKVSIAEEEHGYQCKKIKNLLIKKVTKNSFMEN